MAAVSPRQGSALDDWGLILLFAVVVIVAPFTAWLMFHSLNTPQQFLQNWRRRIDPELARAHESDLDALMLIKWFRAAAHCAFFAGLGVLLSGIWMGRQVALFGGAYTLAGGELWLGATYVIRRHERARLGIRS